MTTTAEPRLTYVCPQCKQRIVRVYTAAQVGKLAPEAHYRGIVGGAVQGAAGPYSADLQPFRSSDDVEMPLLLRSQQDLAVSCIRCRTKHSAPPAQFLDDLRSGAAGVKVLRTRRVAS
jgi:hypothetical protein